VAHRNKPDEVGQLITVIAWRKRPATHGATFRRAGCDLSGVCSGRS